MNEKDIEVEVLARKVKSLDIKSDIKINFTTPYLYLAVFSTSTTDGFFIKCQFGYNERNNSTEKIKEMMKVKRNGSLMNLATNVLEDEICIS